MSDTMDLPLVSVVLPTRGRPELVRASIQGVVSQDYAGMLQCVVVHDQEPADESLAELSGPRRSVEAVQNDGTPGLAGARNAGLRLAKGDFIASCDDDDVWHPDKIRLQMARMLAEPDLAVLGTGIRLLMAGDKIVDWPGESPTISRSDLLRSRRKELHSSTLLMRRGVFDLAGDYDDSLPESYAEDYEWLLRAVQHGTIGVITTPLADIRKDSRSWFRERAEVVAAALTYLLQVHPELADSRTGHARVLGQIAFAHSVMGHRLEALRWASRALRRWPIAPHAVLTLVHAVTRLDPRVALRLARMVGRGIT